MNRYFAMLAIGLGLSWGGTASAQQPTSNYEVIVPVSAPTSSLPAKAVTSNTQGCCSPKVGGSAPCAAKTGGCASCFSGCSKAGSCHGCQESCLAKLRRWCGYRALPCHCDCCCPNQCAPPVYAFFLNVHGCHGCHGCGSDCSTGGCATGGCAGPR